MKMGIFDPTNMQIFIMEDPQMTFRGIWSKTGFFSNSGIFDPTNMQSLVMGDPQMTFGRIWSKNGSFSPTTL